MVHFSLHPSAVFGNCLIPQTILPSPQSIFTSRAFTINPQWKQSVKWLIAIAKREKVCTSAISMLIANECSNVQEVRSNSKPAKINITTSQKCFENEKHFRRHSGKPTERLNIPEYSYFQGVFRDVSFVALHFVDRLEYSILMA